MSGGGGRKTYAGQMLTLSKEKTQPKWLKKIYDFTNSLCGSEALSVCGSAPKAICEHYL